MAGLSEPGSGVVVVGVAGGTGAGKGALVQAVVHRLGPAALLDLDSYYVDRRGLRPAERARLNFDEPAAIEIDLLLEHLERLTAGLAVEKPVYAFATHRRVGVTPLLPAPLVIVEGLFTLWWERLRALLDVKVYVEAAADLRLARRLRRDLRDRGRDAASVLTQYLNTVRPMHAQYVEPTRAFADVVIVNEGDLPASVEALCLAVARVGQTRRHEPVKNATG